MFLNGSFSLAALDDWLTFSCSITRGFSPAQSSYIEWRTSLYPACCVTILCDIAFFFITCKWNLFDTNCWMSQESFICLFTHAFKLPAGLSAAVFSHYGFFSFRSTDYGSTYERMNDKVGSKTVLSYLYVCPSNKRKVRCSFIAKICSLVEMIWHVFL